MLLLHNQRWFWFSTSHITARRRTGSIYANCIQSNAPNATWTAMHVNMWQSLNRMTALKVSLLWCTMPPDHVLLLSLPVHPTHSRVLPLLSLLLCLGHQNGVSNTCTCLLWPRACCDLNSLIHLPVKDDSGLLVCSRATRLTGGCTSQSHRLLKSVQSLNSNAL